MASSPSLRAARAALVSGIAAVGVALGEVLAARPQVLAGSRFAMELGRWLAAEAGVYLTRVVDRKTSHGETFLVTDGGLHHQLAASGNFGTVIRRNYPIAVANAFDREPVETVSVVGCLCTPLDRLGDQVALPRADHPTSMGRAIPHAEILVCRPDGTITADEEPGELVHCGPLVAKGYWRDPERTAERFKAPPRASEYGGTAVWSGDTVRRDANGLLTFVGRDDAMIKTAGNRVSPTEVEDVAVASGLIYEAVAFGVPDARLGAAIVLIVRGKGGVADEAGLSAHLRQNLPNFMQPQAIEWRNELPRNPNGKLDRVAIAAAWSPKVTA